MTDEQMKHHLQLKGYDLHNGAGEYDEEVFLEIASVVEPYQWDETENIWRERA